MAMYGATDSDGRWRRCTSLLPRCMGRAAAGGCTCTEPPPGSIQEAVKEVYGRGCVEERKRIVKMIRALHRQLAEGHAIPMGYDWLASLIERNE